MSMIPSPSHSPLIQFGFTQEEVHALRVLWPNPLLGHILEGVAWEIHEQGGTPEEAIDFVAHAVEQGTAGHFFHHDYTAHQAHIVEADPRAKSNLFDRPVADVPDVLGFPAPKHFIVSVLRVARTPREVDTYLNRWQQVLNGTPVINGGSPDTLHGLTAEVDLSAGLLAYVGLSCHCQYP